MAYKLDLSEWTEITTYGQRNCGIFLSDRYPDLILKCDSYDPTVEIVKDVINPQIQLFPDIVDVSKYDGKIYITMQKLDGDITNYYIKYLLDQVLKTHPKKDQLNEIFNLKLRGPYSISLSSKDIARLNSYTVTEPEYDRFIEQLYGLWTTAHKTVMKEVIKIRLDLFSLGYKYTDNKFDNYGFNLEPFRVFFLDWQSGLNDINKEFTWVAIDSLIEDVNKGIAYTMFHESGTLSRRQRKAFYHTNTTNATITGPINVILDKVYTFDMTPFQNNFTTLDEIEMFVGRTPTLIEQFKSEGRTLEDPHIVEQRSRGVPVINYVNNNKMTQIMATIRYRMYDANYDDSMASIRALVEKGANPTIIHDGHSALTFAITNQWLNTRNKQELCNYLLERGAIMPPNAIILAITIDGLNNTQKEDLCTYLLGRGAVMPPDILHNALLWGSDVDLIKYLLANGAKHSVSYNFNDYESDYPSKAIFAPVKTYLQQQKANKMGGRKTYRRKRTTRSRR